MTLANVPKNAQYIDYKCVVCEKQIDENERQKIISLGCVQTWCMLCMAKKYPSDKYLWAYIKSDAIDDTIITRNNILNNEPPIK